jgi:hypothetical protein
VLPSDHRSPCAGGGIDGPVSRVEDLHRAAVDGAELGIGCEGASILARTLAVCNQMSLRDEDRVMQFVHLDAVLAAETRIADMDDGEEPVGNCGSGTAGDAEENLVYERRIGVPRIAARYDAHGRRHDRAGLRHAETRGDFGDGALHGIGDPVGEIGRRHRAGMRVSRDADHAVLAHADFDPPKAAGIGRHGMVQDAIIDADHRRRARAAFREVQAAGLAIDVVAQVDDDAAVRRIDFELDLDRDSVGDAGKRIMPRMNRRPS